MELKSDQERSIQRWWREFRERRRNKRRNRDALMWLTPTWVRLLWGALGLIVGIAATVIVLLVVAPQPSAVAVTPPSNSDVSITLDDTALSNLTAAGLARAGLPFTVTNVHAHILPNNVVQITGDVPVLGGIAVVRRLSVTTMLAVEQGHLVLHIQKASVGGFNLPAVATTAIESSFNERSAELTNSLNVDNTHYVVSGISSSTGELTLRLKRAP